MRVSADDTPAAPARHVLDRPVLVSNLVSGALWLLVPACLGVWSPVLVGAVYVAAMSVFLSAVYARDALTVAQEAMAWVTPWLAALAAWLWVLSTWLWVGSTVEGGGSGAGWLVALWPVLWAGAIATPCYLGWQMGALAVRQLMAWRAGPAPRVPARDVGRHAG